MRRLGICAGTLLLGLAGACGDDDGGCDRYACDQDCRSTGSPGGLCESSGLCRCLGGADADADADAADDGAGGSDDGAGGDTGGGFTHTPGTQAAVDRSTPCTESELSQWRMAPEDSTVAQACLPNYYIWTPVVCGNPLPDCTCDDTACLEGEAAKPINGGDLCICLNLCETQDDAARCGAANERDCIPVDDWTGSQVFICGGES